MHVSYKAPKFLWISFAGWFWVLQQWGFFCLLQGREGGNVLEAKCSWGEPRQQTAEGPWPHPPSHTPLSLQVTAEAQRWAVALWQGCDLPTSWSEPALSSCLLISVADTWWQGWGKKLPHLKLWQGQWKMSLEGAEKVRKQVIAGCWRWGCVVSVLQVWAWLMRKLWREANSPSAWQFQPSLTRVGLGTDREEHRDCTARAVQVTDEYQGSKMLLLDLSAVFDALRYCWVAFDPRQE